MQGGKNRKESIIVRGMSYEGATQTKHCDGYP